MSNFESFPDRLRIKLKIQDEFMRNVLCEFVCTTFLLFGGTSTNACAVLGRGAFNDWLGVNFGWGFSLLFAVQLGVRVSGAHLNPAVSFASFTMRQLSAARLIAYWVAQIAGGFVGSLLTFVMYYDMISEFDGHHRYVTGPKATAGMFATYPHQGVGLCNQIVDQVFGTAVLMLCVCCITDRRNKIPTPAQPALIASVVTLIGIAWGMNTGYAVNPARDLGPRLFTLFIGYGGKVFSIHNYSWFWVPIICPLIGATIGGWLYFFTIGFHIPSDLDEIEDEIYRSQKSKQAVTLLSGETPQSSVHPNLDSRVV